MEKRLRPMTYAESLEAKRKAEELDIMVAESEKKPEISHNVTTLNKVEVTMLPSGGSVYPKNCEIYFSPLTFGEMKFLSGSSLSDSENIEFFMKKVQANFDIGDLTYYDFYYITVLIKLATFGDTEYKMTFTCNSCGHINQIPFSTNDLEFEEIRVPLPVSIDLVIPFELSNGEKIKTVKFRPISISRFQDMVRNGDIGDNDVYMANCIADLDYEDRIKLIKEVLVGEYTQLLESVDVYLFHGVKDIQMKCKNVLIPEGMSEEEFKNKRDEGEIVGEVCGRVHDIPFQYLSEYVSSTDSFKDIIGKRIHFGV